MAISYPEVGLPPGRFCFLSSSYAPDSPAGATCRPAQPPPPKSDRTEWSRLQNRVCPEKFKIAVF